MDQQDLLQQLKSMDPKTRTALMRKVNREKKKESEQNEGNNENVDNKDKACGSSNQSKSQQQQQKRRMKKANAEEDNTNANKKKMKKPPPPQQEEQKNKTTDENEEGGRGEGEGSKKLEMTMMKESNKKVAEEENNSSNSDDELKVLSIVKQVQQNVPHHHQQAEKSFSSRSTTPEVFYGKSRQVVNPDLEIYAQVQQPLPMKVHPTYSSSSISPNTVDLPVSQKFMMMGNRKKSSSSTAAATAAADTIGTSNNTSSSSSAVVKEPKTPSPHRSTSLNMADECGRKTAGIEQVSKPNAKKADVGCSSSTMVTTSSPIPGHADQMPSELANMLAAYLNEPAGPSSSGTAPPNLDALIERNYRAHMFAVDTEKELLIAMKKKLDMPQLFYPDENYQG